MTTVRMMTHVPLVRIDAPRAEIGGGALVALAFDDYDDLLLGSFTDERRRYEATAPVYFVSELDIDVPEAAIANIAEDTGPREVSARNGLDVRLSFLFDAWDSHVTSCARVRDALALAAPSAAIPDPSLSLRIIDVAGELPFTQTAQGQADQELLFLDRAATFALANDALTRARELLEVVDGCEGELRAAIDALHGAADLSLTSVEQLTLCTIALEALLLPELTTGLKQIFAARLARLVGGNDTEAVARQLYESRSEAVHGDAGADAAPGVAQNLLARAVIALAERTRDGTTLAEVRARLDADPPAPGAPAAAVEPPPRSPRILHALRPGAPPTSSSHALATGGPPIDDPEIDEDQLVLFAPLVGLEVTTPPPELADVGFPLTWIWPTQVGSLEDPDIRRDWIASVTHAAPPMLCLALATPAADRFLSNAGVDDALVPLRQRMDTAVTAMRLAGLSTFHDPDLLGLYARDGRGARFRRPAVYRQTVVAQLRGLAEPLEADVVADLAALWPLLLDYEAGRRHPEIDHALSLFRRAHVWLSLGLATRLQLLFASLEAAIGRLPRDGVQPLARLSDLTGDRDAAAFEWYATNGRPLRNAIAHGEWTPAEEDPRGRAALSALQELLGEVLPALLMAWRRRQKAGPAKTLAAALADPHAELDWRGAAAAGDLAPDELPLARDQRYRGLDTAIMIDLARGASAAGDDVRARVWFERVRDHGDARGDYGLGLIALEAGDADAAQARLSRAAEGGVVAALVPLGKLARDRGDLDAGRRYLRQAMDLGDDDAVISLAVLERVAGNLDAARDLYARAYDAGDLRAAYNRGLLEEKAGDPQAALHWFTIGAEAGLVGCMGWAGDLEAQLGDRETARVWWRKAAENGDANSAGRLGEAALEDGDLAGARAWFERAAAAGLPQAALRLQQLDAAARATDDG